MKTCNIMNIINCSKEIELQHGMFLDLAATMRQVLPKAYLRLYYKYLDILALDRYNSPRLAGIDPGR